MADPTAVWEQLTEAQRHVDRAKRAITDDADERLIDAIEMLIEAVRVLAESGVK
jgi:hypothetical protein